MDDNTRKTEQARRAVACEGWRPMPGMLDAEGVRYCTLVDGRPHGARQSGHAAMFRGLPDLDDPATLGCLLSLVREAWSDSDHRQRWVFVAPDVDVGGFVVRMLTTAMGHRVVRPFPGRAFAEVRGETEAAALVSALEAAPGGGS